MNNANDPSGFGTKTLPKPFDIGNLPKLAPQGSIHSDDVIEFLEKRSSPYEFEYLGYEVRNTDHIDTIYLMINPDPRNFKHVPSNSLVVCHHKVSVYHNRVYESILDQVKNNQFNLYNYHLAWDVMEGGIGDSFLIHLGIAKKKIEKVDLTYENHGIHNLGFILKKQLSLDFFAKKLSTLNVRPTVIINPKCCYKKVGYIPGGGFVDSMMIEMREHGVDVLISSDPNWVTEIIARELDMTLIAIDHYVSERYGLQTMQKLLESTFPEIPTIILEDMDSIQCPSTGCGCVSDKVFYDTSIKT